MIPAKSYRDRLPERAGFPITRPSIDGAPVVRLTFGQAMRALFRGGR